MLKLLLSHWQSHREPLPFVLTDDPLYCSHLTKSPFPEVYSVNRINPIFEEDEDKASNNSTPPPFHKRLPGDGVSRITENDDQFKTYPAKRKTVKLRDSKSISCPQNFVLRKPVKTNSNAIEYSSSHFRYFTPDSLYENSSKFLKRSLSEETREDETKSSDDTGYSSSGQFKSLTTLESDGSVEIHPMSSDSDDCSRPEALIVSADVHRVSTPDDILVRSPSSESSANYSYRSYGGSSPEPFDSLTMSSITDSSVKETDRRRPNSAVREKLQKLLEKGNPINDDRKMAGANDEMEIQKTKNDLMKSLTRALNNKVPKREGDEHVVTRSDDTHTKPMTVDRKSNSSSTSPKSLLVNSEPNGITRQDESNSSSLSSFTKSRNKQHSQRNSKNSSEKEPKSAEDSSDSQTTHKCKLCENAHRPLAFHQLLPGHWSYDNVYLPQMQGMLCPCMHHHHGLSVPPSSDDDVFYPLYYHHDMSRTRHSWAPYTNMQGHKTESKGVSTSSKENTTSTGARYSPDGETDSSNTSSTQLKKSFSERRSLREPKKCKCERCLSSVLDKGTHDHNCTCYCLSHRRVKFASDSDISQHRHMQSFRMRSCLASGDPINAALVMNLPHLNGHVKSKGKDNGKSKKDPPLIPRGLKEPVKMDELYRSYPINFRDWEAHYRRNFLQKRKKRALTMVGMAIGIILVVGIAVALTFVFLRIRRPAS